MELTKREYEALAECARYRRGTYSWRVASMKKLEAKGFVEKTERTDGYSGDVWILTASGESALVPNARGEPGHD